MHLLSQVISISSRTERKSGQSRRQKPTLEFLEERALLSGGPATQNWVTHDSMAITLLSTASRPRTSITMSLTKNHPSNSTIVHSADASDGHQANPHKHLSDSATQPRHANGELVHICLHRAVAFART
jgi:hypothetical protein